MQYPVCMQPDKWMHKLCLQFLKGFSRLKTIWVLGKSELDNTKFENVTFNVNSQIL